MLNDSLDYGNSSVFDDDLTSNINVPYIVAEVLVAIAAIIGNALVIVVYLKDRRLRRRTKYYIISLAIADLLVGNFILFFAFSLWKKKNRFYCYWRFCCRNNQLITWLNVFFKPLKKSTSFLKILTQLNYSYVWWYM